MTKEFLHDDPIPAGFTACPWCPASGPPNFMNGHMKRHDHVGEARAKDEGILQEIADERIRQDDKWGEQNHPDGTGTAWVMPLMPFEFRDDVAEQLAEMAKRHCQRKALGEELTFVDIALEEIAEAFAETDPERLRAELVQAAAVLVAWIGAIDRRKTEEHE